MGDAISELPVDNSTPTPEERQVLAMISPVSDKPLPADKSAPLPVDNSSEIRALVIATVLFVIFTRDFVDTLIVRIVPSADTWYYKTAIRTVLFAALYFLLTYFPVLGR